MAIPEAQLDTWSKQGSVTQSQATYATVRNCLEPLRDCRRLIYLSYAAMGILSMAS